MRKLPVCSFSVFVSLWASISNSPQPRMFSRFVIPSLKVTLASPSVITISPTYVPSIVNLMVFLNPAPWIVPEFGQVTWRVSPDLIFWACSSKVNLTVVWPPLYNSFDETVNELTLLLTSAACTTFFGVMRISSNGKKAINRSLGSCPLIILFIFSNISPKFLKSLFVLSTRYRTIWKLFKDPPS